MSVHWEMSVDCMSISKEKLYNEIYSAIQNIIVEYSSYFYSSTFCYELCRCTLLLVGVLM